MCVFCVVFCVVSDILVFCLVSCVLSDVLCGSVLCSVFSCRSLQEGPVVHMNMRSERSSSGVHMGVRG